MDSGRRQLMNDLTTAVQKILEYENVKGVLADYVLVAAAVSYDTENGESAITLHSGPIAQPDYRIRGLLHEGLLRLDEWTDDGEDDDQ